MSEARASGRGGDGGGGNQIVARICSLGKEGKQIRRELRDACAEAGDPLTLQAIFAWRELKQGVPPRRVEIVARVLGLQKSDIRPDLFRPRDNRGGQSNGRKRRLANKSKVNG